MKRLSIVLLVVVFVIPNVTFAAWWNPVSWFSQISHFLRKAPPTQVLEDRMESAEPIRAEPVKTATPEPSKQIIKKVSSPLPIVEAPKLAGTTTSQNKIQEANQGQASSSEYLSRKQEIERTYQAKIADLNRQIDDIFSVYLKPDAVKNACAAQKEYSEFLKYNVATKEAVKSKLEELNLKYSTSLSAGSNIGPVKVDGANMYCERTKFLASGSSKEASTLNDQVRVLENLQRKELVELKETYGIE